MRGVVIMSWRTPQGHPDTFVLAFADQASDRWLRLADVVVHPNQSTPSAAMELAVGTLRRLTGCTMVVVGVDGNHGVPCCISAGSAYVLALSRSSRPATSSAFGSPLSE